MIAITACGADGEVREKGCRTALDTFRGLAVSESIHAQLAEIVSPSRRDSVIMIHVK